MLEKFLRKSSWTDIILSLIFVLFGALLVANPNAVLSMISIILGGIFITTGIFRLINYFSSNKTDKYFLGIAGVAILIGIIIMFCSGIIMSIFRVILGIWIMYSGVMSLQTAIVWKDYKSRVWLISLIFSIIVIIGGIYILVNTGAIMQTIGTIIIIYGVVNIIESIIFIKNIDNYWS